MPIPYIRVPLAAHDHRVLNWLIYAINTQEAGGTPVPYSLGWLPGTAASGASPAMAMAEPLPVETEPAPQNGPQTAQAGNPEPPANHQPASSSRRK